MDHARCSGHDVNPWTDAAECRACVCLYTAYVEEKLGGREDEAAVVVVL
jgi:hypothetical protein